MADLKKKMEEKIALIKELQEKSEAITAEQEKVVKKAEGEKQQILQEMLRLDGECRLLDQMIKESDKTTIKK